MSGTLGVVAFSYTDWTALFPEMDSVTQAQATLYFNLATQYCDNTASSVVQDASVGGQRETFLNLITAHIAKLFGTVNGQAPSGVVGRITDASEGSVSVSAQMPDPKSQLEGWFNQTPYGAAFWASSAQYRTFRYSPRGATFSQARANPSGFAIPPFMP